MLSPLFCRIKFQAPVNPLYLLFFLHKVKTSPMLKKRGYRWGGSAVVVPAAYNSLAQMVNVIDAQHARHAFVPEPVPNIYAEVGEDYYAYPYHY